MKQNIQEETPLLSHSNKTRVETKENDASKPTKNNSKNILQLNPDLFSEVFSFLELEELLCMRQINKQFRAGLIALLTAPERYTPPSAEINKIIELAPELANETTNLESLRAIQKKSIKNYLKLIGISFVTGFILPIPSAIMLSKAMGAGTLVLTYTADSLLVSAFARVILPCFFCNFFFKESHGEFSRIAGTIKQKYGLTDNETCNDFLTCNEYKLFSNAQSLKRLSAKQKTATLIRNLLTTETNNEIEVTSQTGDAPASVSYARME